MWALMLWVKTRCGLKAAGRGPAQPAYVRSPPHVRAVATDSLASKLLEEEALGRERQNGNFELRTKRGN